MVKASVHPAWRTGCPGSLACAAARWPKNANRVTNTAMSAASNAMNHRSSGRTSANQGRSHRPYWGEYTLFESRKSTRIGNPRCHLGVSGSRRTFQAHTAADATTNATTEKRLTVPVSPHPPDPNGSHAMNHRLSQSARRWVLYRKNPIHLWGGRAMHRDTT